MLAALRVLGGTSGRPSWRTLTDLMWPHVVWRVPQECARGILLPGRSFCPSCEKKKQLLWAERLREEVLLPVAHRHVVEIKTARGTLQQNGTPSD